MDKKEKMNDEQLIKLLEKVKKRCDEHEDCTDCPLEVESTQAICRINWLFTKLSECIPCNWEIEEIKEIIND